MNPLLIILVVIVIVVAVVLPRMERREPGPEKVREKLYMRKPSVMSENEKLFYRALLKAVGHKYVILSQVRLPGLLEVRVEGKMWQRAFNWIAQKSVDFVLINPENLETVCAIEIDDRSHGKRGRKTRDSFVEKACREANVKLVRFKARSSYDVDFLEKFEWGQ